MKQLFDKKNIIQFISYVFVGGVAALVEWVTFFAFGKLFSIMDISRFAKNKVDLGVLLATVIAFVLATFVNWVVGRMTTFKEVKSDDKKEKEAFAVFLVSAVGLVFNLILMWLFVDVCGFDSDLEKMISKIAATGIVFFWNFFSRKVLIYREK